jgi:hypothetical protein
LGGDQVAPHTAGMSTKNAPRAACARIVGQCDVRLWELTSHERLKRQLDRAGVTRILGDGGRTDPDCTVVLVRADHLFEDRTVIDLVRAANVVVRTDDGTEVAAHVSAELEPLAVRRLSGGAREIDTPELGRSTPAEISAAYLGPLLKASRPAVLPIRSDQKSALERRLFDGSYKGVTDLVTKWVLPAPARWATRICARLGIRPNLVTAASLVLAIFVTFLFASGRYAWGLAAAWLMTFLDTVDGKLARVTVDSSTFGHLFDHAIDLIHPPFWYVAWGIGLASLPAPGANLPLDTLFGVIVGAYVAGRLLEGAFDFGLGKFSIFCWRPVDSYFRLIMARRNPNLLLLTGAALTRRHDLGLIAVALWTALSTLFLSVRIAMATRARLAGVELRPWLDEQPQPTVSADSARI